MFETIVRGSLAELCAQAESMERGEVTLVVGGAAAPEIAAPPDLGPEIEALRAEGLHTRDIANRLAEKYDLSRHEVYQRVVQG